MGGHDNDTSKGLAEKVGTSEFFAVASASRLYEKYLAHPTAQFRMSFSEYKRKNRPKRKRSKRRKK